MRLDDPSARRLRRSCRVARIATMSRRGRPSVNPLYYVVSGDEILLGTSTWTLAARNVVADERVCVLFEAEPGPTHTMLRVTGRGEVRTDRRAVRAFRRRCAVPYVLAPGALRNMAAHWRQHRLRIAYYAQSSERGAPCVIAVRPEHVETVRFEASPLRATTGNSPSPAAGADDPVVTGRRGDGKVGDEDRPGRGGANSHRSLRSDRRHRRRRWLIGAGATVAVIVVAGLVILRLLVGGPAPAPLALPSSGAGTATTIPSASDPSGTWRVHDGSTVGYRVDQIIVGTRSTITGRTDQVTGSVTITGPSVTAASFRVDLDDLATNDSQRQALDVSTHPHAELTLTTPIDLGAIPAPG